MGNKQNNLKKKVDDNQTQDLNLNYKPETDIPWLPIPCWTNLNSYQTQEEKCYLQSNPSILNSNEFIMPVSNKMCKYNTKTNKYTEYKDLHIDTHFLGLYIDKKTNQLNKIYTTAMDSKEYLSIIDAKTNKLQTSHFGDIIDGKSFFVIHENTLHIIGGKDSYKHCTADINGNNVEIKHIFNFTKSNNYRSGFGFTSQFSDLVYLKSNRTIYGFGGDTDYDIWKYNLFTNEWKKLNIKLPLEMWDVAVVSSSNEKYILFFGGLMSWHGGEDYIEHDCIYIWDLESMKFKESKVVCPRETGSYRAVTMRSVKDELVVYGYLRNMKFSVKGIYQQIVLYYQDEYVHLLDYGGPFTITQCCIPLSQLVNST